MDEGLPIAYELLDDGVPVLDCDGRQVGTVGCVLSAPEEDVFHGILLNTAGGVRFVGADTIAAIHERGVDLRIDSAAAATLPGPEHKAPVYDDDPERQRRWHHWVHRLTGRSDWHHET